MDRAYTKQIGKEYTNKLVRLFSLTKSVCCMHECASVYMCVRVCFHEHTRSRLGREYTNKMVFVYVLLYIQTCACTYTYVYVCVCVRECAWCAYVHMCACVNVCVCMLH